MIRLLSIIVVLCGSARAEDLPVWRHAAVNPSGDSGFVFMAAKAGFGAPFGLRIEMVSMRGDPLLLKALVAGELDSYTGSPASPMIAASKGAPVRIVGCNWIRQSYTFWGRGPVESLADVRGRLVGISSPGSAVDTFIRTVLRGAGVDPAGVRFVVTGTPADSLRAMSAGLIDAAATNDEYAGRARGMGLHEIATTLQATPLAVQRCYYVTTDTLRSRGDAVARFLAAEMTAYRYALGHRAETVALTRSLMQAPADAPEPGAAFDAALAHHVLDLSFGVPLASLDWLRDQLATDGHLSGNFDPSSMVDTGPLDQARGLVGH